MPVRKTSAANDSNDWEKWNKKISAFSYTDCDSFFPSVEDNVGTMHLKMWILAPLFFFLLAKK